MNVRRRINVRRTAWFGAASVAVATWLAASTAGPTQPAASVQPPRPAPVDRYTDALRQEADRLHARIAPSATPTLRRDLFRYTPQLRASAGRSQAVEPAATPVAAPVAPPLKLIGIAEDTGPDGAVRTAIVSGFGDVFLVKPGDIIADRYRVQTVSPEAVRVVESATGVETTLALR